MFTPGSGPATVGVNGFSVFVSVQLPAASAQATAKAVEAIRFMKKGLPKVHKPV